MARTRLIRPGFFKDGDLYDAEQATGLPLRVAFAGLWTVTDREGRFPWKPRELKPDALPHDPVDFGKVLEALASYDFVQRYSVDGREYGLIPKFNEHQTFHRTEPPSRLPPPPATVEPPLQPREAPVVSREDSVAVAVTDADRMVVVRAEEYALQITVAANSAITKRWGEQTHPLIWGQSYGLVADLQSAGVPLETATASVAAQCEKSQKLSPPKGIAWFRAGILQDHAEQKQRELQPAVQAEGDALDRWLVDQKAKEVAHA